MPFQEHLLPPFFANEDDESRHYRVRLGRTFMLFAMVALVCFLLFDYFQVPNAWPLLWTGRLLLLGICLCCFLLLRREGAHPDNILLFVMICANSFFCFGAALIDDALSLTLWNLCFATSMLIVMPVWLIWGWRYQLASSLPLIVGYVPIYLWLSPLSLMDLVGAGGAFILCTLCVAPILANARGATFQRTVSLRRALQARNDELQQMNQRLLNQQKELEYRANHDLLTGLPNRRFGLEFLEQILGESNRTQHCMSILFVDVDRLKHVNDSFGHAEGDQLIQTVAEEVSRAAGDEGLACRMGGDEFLIVLPGSCDMSSQQAATELTRRLRERRLQEQVAFPMDVSIGRVTHDPVMQGEMDVDDLIHIADDRMYRQKRARRRAMAGVNHHQA